MIKKVNGGYVAKSETGKTLSRTYTSRRQAQKRLNQIHYFQSKRKGG